MSTGQRAQGRGHRGRGHREVRETKGRKTSPDERDHFSRRVLATLSRVPVGRVVTYGDLAMAAGFPRAARAVGTLMRTAGRPGVPYHRVIAAGGKLGGYGGHVELKASLLRAEGVIVHGTRIVDFRSRRWPDATARSSRRTRRKNT
jgi:methylated-DNA-[protein]-cysteine S-methyltransferase